MGYSTLWYFWRFLYALGGYAGGQAEYARVPFADTGLFKIPDGRTDEQVVFLNRYLPPTAIWRREL